MPDNSDLPKPSVAAHFDEPSMNNKAIPVEKMAEYFLAMTREESAARVIRSLMDEGLVVDEIVCTLFAAAADFISTVYKDDEQRACSAWGHLTIWGHAMMHELFEVGRQPAEENEKDDD